MLLDGAEKQLDIVLNLIFGHRRDMTIVLDFIHVLEYVWKAARSFCATGSKEAQQWVCERALKILQRKSSAVAQTLRQGLSKLSREKRKAVKKCAEYLEKYEPLLHYHQFLKEGLSIATGVIEGACRHLIKDRMDLTGARWQLDMRRFDLLPGPVFYPGAFCMNCSQLKIYSRGKEFVIVVRQDPHRHFIVEKPDIKESVASDKMPDAKILGITYHFDKTCPRSFFLFADIIQGIARAGRYTDNVRKSYLVF